MQLTNYACGQWIAGTGTQTELTDAITGDLIATSSSGGLDFGAMLKYGRETGGPPLRKIGIGIGEPSPTPPWAELPSEIIDRGSEN